MPKPLLDRVRKFCLSLPDTEESSRLGGEPHFYVGGKIFAGCGHEDGVVGVGMKVGLDLQSILVQRDGIRVAKYVGRYGWITVEEHALQDQAELERLLQRSYDLITKGSACDPGDAAARPKAKPKKRAAANKAAAKGPRGPTRKSPLR